MDFANSDLDVGTVFRIIIDLTSKIATMLQILSGFGIQTMKALVCYRHCMTLGEIFTHLDLLNKLSCEEKSKIELSMCLRPLVMLFQEMLLEYNDSEMNIIITNILNNIVSESLLKYEEEQEASPSPKLMMVADTATEVSITKQTLCYQPFIHFLMIILSIP